jgi:hypothetical protein
MEMTGNPIAQKQNIFFEKIKEQITKKITDNTLVKDLQRIALAFEADERTPLAQRDFETLGMMAYLNGLDYTSQLGGLTSPVMLNVVKRFSDLSIPLEAIAAYQLVIKAFHPSTLEAPKDETTTMVERTVPLPANRMMPIRSAINTILNNNTYPVMFALDIDRIKRLKTFTYQDFLKINSLIYEQVDLNGKYIRTMNQLYMNRDMREILNQGSDYFDLSKFALVYYESIFSVKEFQAINGYPEIAPYYENPDTIEQLPVKHEMPEQEYVAPDPSLVNKPKYSPPVADQNDTDGFIKAVIEECAGLKVETVSDFMQALAAVIADEKLSPTVYKYIKANMAVRRTAFADVWGAGSADMLDALMLEIEDQKEKYKDLVIRYTEELPVDNAGRIVRYVNELIEACVMHGGERKSILMQQVNNNQITTYKHLNETINKIEECKIDGAKSDKYTQLHDYLLNSAYPFVTLFEEVQSIDLIQSKLSIYGGLADFFKVEVTEENSFASFMVGKPEYTAKATAEDAPIVKMHAKSKSKK